MELCAGVGAEPDGVAGIGGDLGFEQDHVEQARDSFGLAGNWAIICHMNAAADLDLIIVGTVTPDMFFPSTGCILQERLGAPHAAAFDLSAACSGFVYALTVAHGLIAAGAAERLVVIGNGMAPGRVLEKLFELAPERYAVTIFNAEPRVNYDRIMLSPVLSGEKSFEEIDRKSTRLNSSHT